MRSCDSLMASSVELRPLYRGRNAVEIYVQTVGQLAYGDADAAGAEVV